MSNDISADPFCKRGQKALTDPPSHARAQMEVILVYFWPTALVHVLDKFNRGVYLK